MLKVTISAHTRRPPQYANAARPGKVKNVSENHVLLHTAHTVHTSGLKPSRPCRDMVLYRSLINYTIL